jgi:RNA polymerase sigma-70 factor (ECF subfamily)
MLTLLAATSLVAAVGFAQNAQEISVEAMPPVVVKTAPGVVEIKVTFSKEMTDKSWSWSTAWQGSTAESAGDIRYEGDHKTCVWRVKLEPNRTYAYWLNSEKFRNFKDKQGHAAVPYLLVFQTKGS